MYTFSRKDEIDSSFAVVMSIFERKARQFIEALIASNKNLVKTSLCWPIYVKELSGQKLVKADR